jgi:hypothetical protein
MNQITGESSECCNEENPDFQNIESDNITNSNLIETLNLDVTDTTTTLNLSVTNTLNTSNIDNTNNIDTNILKSNTNYHVTSDSLELYNNFINYTTNLNLYQLIIPPPNNSWSRLQDYLNPANRTIQLIKSADIKIGDRMRLNLGLQITDSQQASPKIYEFQILFGSVQSQTILTTIPPKHLTPTYISLDTEIVCSDKTGTTNFNFVFKSVASYNNDGGNEQKTCIISNQIVNIPQTLDFDIQYLYRENTGNNTQVIINRGIYSFYKY